MSDAPLMVVYTPGLPEGLPRLISVVFDCCLITATSMKLVDCLLAEWGSRRYPSSVGLSPLQQVTVFFAESPEMMAIAQQHAQNKRLEMSLVELAPWEIQKLRAWCASVCPGIGEDLSGVVPLLDRPDGLVFPSTLLVPRRFPPEKRAVT